MTTPSSRNRFPSALSAGLFIVGTTGACNMTQFTANTTAANIKLASAIVDREADPQFARESAPASLVTAEGFLYASPENPDLLETVTQGYAQYAFGFLEDDLEKMDPNQDTPEKQNLVRRCTIFYERAFGYGVQMAALVDKKFPDALNKGDQSQLEAILAKSFKKPEQAPGIYWAGLSMGSAINLHRDDMNRVADIPKALALLEHTHKIAPLYFNHGAALSLGVFYASQGKAMGGNPERAKEMFDEVIKATDGKYLMAKVLFARYYATVTQDRELFEKTLKDVLATPTTVWPQQRLANELAHAKAERYLKQVEDLF